MLSHTDGLIVLGVSPGQDLDIDTENVHMRKSPVGVADGFFAVDEVAALRELPEEDQNERFHSYWTLKEAYIKARGMGVPIPLDKFSFGFPDNRRINVTFRPPLNDSPTNWYFMQFYPSTEHLATLCIEGDGQIASDRVVAIRKTVPLNGEETIICPITRRSTQQHLVPLYELSEVPFALRSPGESAHTATSLTLLA